MSFAGHETTTNLLANAVRQLLSHGEAWETLVRDPARIGNVELPAGAKVLLLLCAANRDAAQFPAPDRFDVECRDARKHLSFGKGIHFCLGAGLARLEAAIVLERLAARFPRVALAPADALAFHPNVAFRGPRQLWLEPAPAA